MYNRRYLHDNLTKRPTAFRAVLLTGPRRAGKSTFATQLLRDWGGGSSVSFDTPRDQARFAEDPEGFLRALQLPALLDEVQNVPDLFRYLKKIIDEDPTAACDYILTGSQQFQMMRHVTESLAGRILIKELLPFCLGEIHRAPSSRVLNNLTTLLNQGASFELRETAVTRTEIMQHIVDGGFPQSVLANSETEREDWFSSYVETYIQRDVRALSNIQDLALFSRFVTLVAGRTAQTINYSELGKDIGMNYKTSQRYLSLLETSYLWKSLPPFYRAGSEKRLVKSPKGIFLDSGLATYLVGLKRDGVERNPLLGALFEGLVITDLLKLCAATGQRISACYFRAAERYEVDLVLEIGARVVPIEIKLSASPEPSWGKSIRILRDVARMSDKDIGYVISLAPEAQMIGPGIFNLPLGCFL